MLAKHLTAGLMLTLGWVGANAQVTSSSEHGFVSTHELVLVGTPAAAYHALTEQVHLWWDASHSYGGDAAAFSLEAKAGGCFCERLANGGSVEHMRVVHANPSTHLTMHGGLGPLQNLGVSGAMSFSFAAHDETKTTLRYTYVVGGFADGGLLGWADPVDRVQLGQLQRLQQFLATGEPLN